MKLSYEQIYAVIADVERVPPPPRGWESPASMDAWLRAQARKEAKKLAAGGVDLDGLVGVLAARQPYLDPDLVALRCWLAL